MTIPWEHPYSCICLSGWTRLGEAGIQISDTPLINYISEKAWLFLRLWFWSRSGIIGHFGRVLQSHLLVTASRLQVEIPHAPRILPRIVWSWWCLCLLGFFWKIRTKNWCFPHRILLLFLVRAVGPACELAQEGLRRWGHSTGSSLVCVLFSMVLTRYSTGFTLFAGILASSDSVPVLVCLH